MAVVLDQALLDWLREFANQGILTTDTGLTICDWNRWLEVHSGRSASEVSGRNLLELYPELIERRLEQFYRHALAGEVAVLAQRFHRYLLPLPAVTEGGQHVMMQQTVRIAPLYENGRVAGTITVIEDVTERVEREDDLRRARDELEARVQERTAELARAREQLRGLSRRLMEVQENERRAIARELHDEAGQALTSLMLGLGLIEREAANSAAVRERVADLKQTTNSVLENLHLLAVNLRPASLDRVGLVPALSQFMESFERQTGLALDLVTLGLAEGQRFPPEVEVALYRVVQEALTNVARHAQARNVGVIVEYENGRAIAIVEDDGIGFDVKAALQNGRLGLLGMRERVEMLGGRLTLEAGVRSGATVYAEIPSGLAESWPAVEKV